MRRIAVVDDDMDIGNMLQEVLERAGYGVLRAYSGTEALLLLERQRPDLVLLDLMLPGLSGEAVLPHLAGVPVIVLSARGEVQDKVSLLLEDLSRDTPDCVESSLKVHVSNLRRKLREAGAGDMIEAVWGIGFKLRE